MENSLSFSLSLSKDRHTYTHTHTHTHTRTRTHTHTRETRERREKREREREAHTQESKRERGGRKKAHTITQEVVRRRMTLWSRLHWRCVRHGSSRWYRRIKLLLKRKQKSQNQLKTQLKDVLVNGFSFMYALPACIWGDSCGDQKQWH